MGTYDDDHTASDDDIADSTTDEPYLRNEV